MEERWVVEFRRPNRRWEVYNSYTTRAEAMAKVKSSRAERWVYKYQFRCRLVRSKIWTT